MSRSTAARLSVAAALAVTLGASAQSQATRLASDYCNTYFSEETGWWEVWCEIDFFNGDETFTLMRGVEPAWSRDGLRIAGVDLDGELILHSLVNDTTVKFTGTGRVDGPPRWSPDNTRIAFASYRDGQKDLYVISADGSALTRLTDAGVGGGFAWSPNGTAIAFGAAVGGVRELFVMQPDGSNKTRVTYNVGFEMFPDSYFEPTPSWSFDGTRIAFDCAANICSINADGTNFRQLTTDPVWAYAAVFSPVDNRIAFQSNGYPFGEVKILEENGTVTRVAPALLVWQHAWSPDGESLALVKVIPDWPSDCQWQGWLCVPGQQDTIYTVGSDGSGLRQVIGGHHPRWAPSLPGQPSAAFAFNCTGAACQFDATGSFDPDGSLASYVWDFGDGTTGSGATVAHQYATGATYRVKLIVTDQGGAMGFALRTVSANAPPVASSTVTCDGPVCTFDASASSNPDGTISRFYWTFGDGAFQLRGVPTVTHTYPTGTFLVKLVIVDNAGAEARAELTLSVVNAGPVADFTFTCAAMMCTFDASASSDDDGPIFYAWDFGDGRQGSGKIATYAYFAGGTYLARLTVTDGAGQTATTTRTVNVIAPPTLDVHVGDLDGSATTLQGKWNASVTIQIHGEDHQGLGGATVNVSWSDGTVEACATDPSGRCVLSRNGLPNKTTAVTLTVLQVVHGTRPYQAPFNHDPDGGSTGTSITVWRR